MTEDKDKKLSFRDRLRGIKHLDILIAVIVLILALLIYFGLTTNKKKEIVSISEGDKVFLAELQDVISSIDGVGKAKVVINYDDDVSIDIAMRTESVTKVDKDGVSKVVESTSEPVIIRDGKGDKPIILKESAKSIKGVVVVANGASDPRVKLSIIDAISTLLKITPDKIKVYEMN